MADRYASRRAEESEKDHLMQLVGFVNGKELFGVDILMVQEIIRGAPITSVPNAPVFVEGVTNLRGNIIPVIDLRKRLNLSSERPVAGKNWILILDIGGRITGFIVDAVTEVLKIVAGLESQYIQGVCDIGDRLLVLLDFNRILLVEEIRRLKDLGGGRPQPELAEPSARSALSH